MVRLLHAFSRMPEQIQSVTYFDHQRLACAISTTRSSHALHLVGYMPPLSAPSA